MGMPDSAAKRKWDKENVLIMSVKLFKNTDADLLEYLEGKQRGPIVKAALREYIENHKEEKT